LSDAHVLDAASPARCEWVELLGDDPRWQPLLHMHRPYETLTHWALAAHVERTRQRGTGPLTGRPLDLVLSTGDNIDNAQSNELQTYLAILGGGHTRLSAYGSVQDADRHCGAGPWPFWCPEATEADAWQARGYPRVPDFLHRASETLHSNGPGCAWASLPGNHDLMRQGTALPEPGIEAIAIGPHKALRKPKGFDPVDPLNLFVDEPAAFSRGADRQVQALASRAAVTRHDWLLAHLRSGAAGINASQAQTGFADTVIDTEHVRLILLDTNHPAGDYQGSVGRAQLAWLDARLREADAQRGRLAILATHHGSRTLTNVRTPCDERAHTQALLAVAHQHPSLVAWLSGHRHVHEVLAHPGAAGGFWEITTASLIDWPSQARAVELLRRPDGQLELACTLVDHEAPPDSLAALHRALAHRFAGPRARLMQGGPGDGDVRLLLPARQ
jgi:metallophosphoesterase (TIGR03767 family)